MCVVWDLNPYSIGLVGDFHLITLPILPDQQSDNEQHSVALGMENRVAQEEV